MKTRSCAWGLALIVAVCGAQTPGASAPGPAIEINHCAGGPPITMGMADRRVLLDDDERQSLLAEMRTRYPILERDDFSAPEILLWRKGPDEWLYVSLRPDGLANGGPCVTATFMARVFRITPVLTRKYAF